MAKVDTTYDIDGRELGRGDTVLTISNQETARVCDMAMEFDTGFVCLRPLHRPYGKGVWHAADRTQLVSKSEK